MEVETVKNSIDLPVIKSNGKEVCAVEIKNIYLGFKYTGNVLRGVNMNVDQSAIYGLLGPSGCGKTTLIKCIAGLYVPAKGTLLTYGHLIKSNKVKIPGRDLGYMPQEGSLYMQLTIIETLLFFARIFLIDLEVIKKSLHNLIKVLELPEDDRQVHTLSGGQKRRLQFAIALVHNPKLVILDEPTAGADPIVRKKIWDYLKYLSAVKKTAIIITTHYIEEARQADRVGLMRKGKIMEESEPRDLLARYSLSTLEEAFLKICIHHPTDEKSYLTQDEQRVSEKDEIIYIPKFGETKIGISELFTTNLLNWMRVVFTIAWKTNLLNIRTPLFLFFQYILPTFPVFLICWCVGGDPFDIKIGIVNEEHPANFSAMFLKKVDDIMMVKIPYDNLETAMTDARSTKIWGVLHIKQNFSYHLAKRIQFDQGVDLISIDKSIVRIHADLSDKLVTIYIERSLENSFLEFVQDLSALFGLKKGIANLPIKSTDPIYAARNLNGRNVYREYIYPGSMILSCFSISYGITSYVVTVERNELMLERYHASAISSLMFLSAHAVTRLLTAIIQSSIVIFAVIYMYDIFPQPSLINLFGILLLLFLQALTGMTLGMVISTVCKNVPTIAATGLGVMIYVLFTSGIIWPIESMPLWLRWWCMIQPTTYPVITLRNILSRDIFAWNKRGLPGYITSIFYIFFFFSLGIMQFKYQ